MNKEETVSTLVAVGLIVIGLSTIIVSEAAYINKLEDQLQTKETALRKLKRYYHDSTNRLDPEQLIQHAHRIGDDLQFESIVKNY